MTKVWPKEPIERMLDEILTYLRGEPALKRNLTTLAQPIAESVQFPKHNMAYQEVVRRMGEKPAAKFLANMSPLDAALWEHFQSASLLKDKIKRWQTRRTLEDQAILHHEKTLDALHAWQQDVRQARIENAQRAVTRRMHLAAEHTYEQSQKIGDSNKKIIQQRAVDAYKANSLLDERFDGVRARAANIAFFRQWLEDVRRSAIDDQLMERNSQLHLKLHELNLLVAAHESALAYGAKPQLNPTSRLSLDPEPTYHLQALNPYKRGA